MLSKYTLNITPLFRIITSVLHEKEEPNHE
jgi:hypothetical protein